MEAISIILTGDIRTTHHSITTTHIIIHISDHIRISITIRSTMISIILTIMDTIIALIGIPIGAMAIMDIMDTMGTTTTIMVIGTDLIMVTIIPILTNLYSSVDEATVSTTSPEEQQAQVL